MSITTEAVKVYRGGGRRWLTLNGAVNAEANAAYRAATHRKDRCECGSIQWDGMDIDDYCKYHDGSTPIYGRYMRYAKRLVMREAA